MLPTSGVVGLAAVQGGWSGPGGGAAKVCITTAGLWFVNLMLQRSCCQGYFCLVTCRFQTKERWLENTGEGFVKVTEVWLKEIRTRDSCDVQKSHSLDGA